MCAAQNGVAIVKSGGNYMLHAIRAMSSVSKLRMHVAQGVDVVSAFPGDVSRVDVET